MVEDPPAYSVVVPARNEAAILAVTVPALLSATAGDRAEIVYVCNGCTDDSASVIRALAGIAARVVELGESGKTAALNAGDDIATVFPRFYIDADTRLKPGDLARLCAVLRSGKADLVSPRLRFSLTGCTVIAAAMASVWLALPYARTAAFQKVIGVSAAGRRRWQDFPPVMADDLFMAAMIAPDRRFIVDAVTAVTCPPTSFRAWVAARQRWRAGERELVGRGIPVAPRPAGQRLALLGQVVRPRRTIGAVCFIAARMIAAGRARPPPGGPAGWTPDRPSVL